MRLNVQSDYALRLLMYLAINKDRLCTISEISAHYRISKNHMMKVAQHLSQSGFLNAVKGRSGGLQLGMTPDRIMIGAVVRVMEADFAIVECFGNRSNKCLITPACRLKKVLREAVEAFLAVLDRFTLADLAGENDMLRKLLETDPA